MAIYDQFDLTTKNGLSGSYASKIILGNTNLSSSISSAATLYNISRRMIGDKSNYLSLGGLFSSSSIFYIPKWRFTDYYDLRYNRSFVGGNFWNINAQSNHFYYDSVMPDMLKICSLNDEFIAAGGVSGLRFSNDNDLKAIGFTTESAFSVTIRSGSQWLTGYPFQNKYKFVSRFLLPGRLTSFISGTANQFGIFAFEYDSDSYRLTDITASNSIEIQDFDLQSDLPPFEDQQASQLTWTMENNKKFFFGSGDGPVNIDPSANPTIQLRQARYSKLPSLVGVAGGDPYWYYGMTLRGFRYGTLNANPIVPKYLFNRNHFGHVRDLFEAPLQSAIYQSDTTLTFPVNVTFVSGTTSYNSASFYMSSSTEVSFNRFDNGMYDIHARVGQPYYDIDNID